jgi:predicted DNA-binding transcriptional regulator YafY
VKSDASPTARALLALDLVQGSPGISADRLADKLGVSERAARRYVGILREAGIPIESLRGPHGGYRIGRGLRLPPLMFNSAEALGLVMAVLDGHHDASDPVDPVGSALGKLLRALPERVARQAEAVRRTTAPAPDRAAARPDPETATVLVQACIDRRRVRLGYRSEAGSEWVSEVDPWAVVVRHGRWYLLCRSSTSDVRRAYRIDRVRAVEVLDQTFSPPADLDPVEMLEEHLAVGWEYDVEVVIDAPVETVARRLPRALGRLEPLDGDTTRLLGTTSNPFWYAEQLAAIPVAYRIVRCPELQHTARVLGQRLVAAADGRDPSKPGEDSDQDELWSGESPNLSRSGAG